MRAFANALLCSAIIPALVIAAADAEAIWLTHTEDIPSQSTTAVFPGTSGVVNVSISNVTDGGSNGMPGITPGSAITGGLTPSFKINYTLNADNTFRYLNVGYTHTLDSYHVVFDFTGLPSGFLPAGATIGLIDIDILENLRQLSATNISGAPITNPWLLQYPTWFVFHKGFLDWSSVEGDTTTTLTAPASSYGAGAYHFLGNDPNDTSALLGFRTTQDIKSLSFDFDHSSNPPKVSTGGYGVAVAIEGPLSVGVNKTLKNKTGQNANDVEILLRGTHNVLGHYDGHAANHFDEFEVSYEPPGNTRLRWSNPNNPVLPNQVAHLGFVIPGTQSDVIMGVFWSFDENITGCARQVNAPHARWGVNPGNLVTFTNDSLACESVSLYVGDAIVRWYADEVPLEDLNAVALGNTTPLQTDIIPSSPVFLPPNDSAYMSIPAAPPGAQYAVLSFKVGTDPGLSTGDETLDFIQTRLADGIAVPLLPSWGWIVLPLLFVALGSLLLVKSRGRGEASA